MPQRLKKLVSSLLVLGFFAMTMSVLVGNACAAGLAGQAKNGCSAGKLISVDKESPCCPCDDDDSPSGHCNPFCSCACHAHLPTEALLVVFTEVVTPLEFHEAPQAIPEVYLSKFIPPHILA
ncbi:MAG TPA: hypothetical protein VJ550_10300 [Geomonas sp.]|nr:hypothetical protein [Geomonas sp.]